MVSVEVAERGDLEITLVLRGVPLEYANAIRRAAMEEVPTIAIDYVVFYENTSALSDEIIAHRLAMVPLKSDSALERYRQPEDCRGDSPPDGCYASLYLEADGEPGREVTVYSGDLRPQEDPEVVPVYSDIPILKLGPRQRVSLEARARLGRGREHIKWSPAVVSVLSYIPKIKVLAERCTLCGLCAENCPSKALVIESGRLRVDEDRCTLCRQCVKVCEPEAIELDWRRDEYKLRVESSGALRPERIVLESVAQTKRKLLELRRELDRVFSSVGVSA